MKVLVKICGLSTPEALDVALDAGADMVGFVFFPPSPRHIGFEAAKRLGARAGARALKVALTVDATNDMLRDIIDAEISDVWKQEKITPAKPATDVTTVTPNPYGDRQ